MILLSTCGSTKGLLGSGCISSMEGNFDKEASATVLFRDAILFACETCKSPYEPKYAL